MKTRLGRQEMMLLAYVQLRKLRVVRTGELTKPLRLNSAQERELFRRLARGGLIARVRRGLYLVPPQLPLGGKWSPNEILATNTLIEDLKGRYQISGPNAFNRYGFDEQIPNRIYVYNNRLSGERNIGTVALTLIKVANERLGSAEKFKTSDGQTAVYSSRTRALVDAVYDWSRFNGLPRAYEWILRELATKRIDQDELAKITLLYGNASTIRRIGVLLERAGAEERLLRRLERPLKRTTSFIPWIPNKPKRGKVNRRWGVVFNEQS
jgi:predicted transcriptional regulator of viral defense system